MRKKLKGVIIQKLFTVFISFLLLYICSQILKFENENQYFSLLRLMPLKSLMEQLLFFIKSSSKWISKYKADVFGSHAQASSAVRHVL